MRLILGIPVMVTGWLGISYFGWVRYAIMHRIDEVWDIDWVMGLWHWYDQRFPVAAGHIKIHGEVERVLFSTQVAVGFSAVLLVSAILFVRTGRSGKPGFDVGWRWPGQHKALMVSLGVVTAVLASSHGCVLLLDRTPRILTGLCIMAGVFWFVWALPLVAMVLWPRGPMPGSLCAGVCRGCGYDLRGNVGTLHCPECGASVWPVTDGTSSPR